MVETTLRVFENVRVLNLKFGATGEGFELKVQEPVQSGRAKSELRLELGLEPKIKSNSHFSAY